MAKYDNEDEFLKGLGVKAVRVTAAPDLLDDAWLAAAVCPRCGGDHPHAQCPQVKAVEYDGRGRLRRVEYFEGTGARPLELSVSSTGGPWRAFTSSWMRVPDEEEEE